MFWIIHTIALIRVQSLSRSVSLSPSPMRNINISLELSDFLFLSPHSTPSPSILLGISPGYLILFRLHYMHVAIYMNLIVAVIWRASSAYAMHAPGKLMNEWRNFCIHGYGVAIHLARKLTHIGIRLTTHKVTTRSLQTTIRHHAVETIENKWKGDTHRERERNGFWSFDAENMYKELISMWPHIMWCITEAMGYNDHFLFFRLSVSSHAL